MTSSNQALPQIRKIRGSLSVMFLRRGAPQEHNARPDDFARIIGRYRVHYPCKIAGQLGIRFKEIIFENSEYTSQEINGILKSVKK